MNSEQRHNPLPSHDSFTDRLMVMLSAYEASLFDHQPPQVDWEQFRLLSADEQTCFESTCRQLDLLYGQCSTAAQQSSPSGVTRHGDASDSLPIAAQFDIDPNVVLGAIGSHLGRFEILRGLGMGGYGIVFLARDPILNRLVALKIPRPDVLASSTMRRRFIAEGRAAADLMHPNIVTVFESGEVGKICYLAQDYIAGPSLSKWLKDLHPGPIPPRVAAHFLMQLAEGVAFAHSRNILHRDIKPGNILLASAQPESGNMELSSFIPKLADFGTAKVIQGDDLTQTVGIVGTPAYMAPEQESGLKNEIGPGTDVYSLGAILFELLTGKAVKQVDLEGSALMKLNPDAPISPRSVVKSIPYQLSAICQKCLSLRVKDRYSTAKDLVEDLRSFLDGRPISARPEGALMLLGRWCLRFPLTASLTFLTFLLTGTLLVGLLWYNARLNESLTVVRQQQKAATQREAVLRRRIYADDVNLAGKAWRNGDVSQVKQILEHYIPHDDLPDLRSFPWWYLWNRSQNTSVLLSQHSGSCSAVAVNSDGTRGASAGNDGAIRIWDLSKRQLLAELHSHASGNINSLQFSPSDGGRRLLSASDDATARIWDMTNLKNIQTIRGHTSWIAVAKFIGKQGNQIASAGGDKWIRIHDSANGELIREWEAHSDAIRDLSENPSDQTLVSSSEDQTIRLWRLQTGTPDPRLPEGGFAVPVNTWARTVIHSHDRKKLVAGFRTGEIVEWSLDEPDFGKLLAQSKLEAGIRQLAMSDDDTIVAGSGNSVAIGTVSESDSDYLRYLRGHTDRINAIATSSSLNGILSGGRSGFVHWLPPDQVHGRLTLPSRNSIPGVGTSIYHSYLLVHMGDDVNSEVLGYHWPDLQPRFHQAMPMTPRSTWLGISADGNFLYSNIATAANDGLFAATQISTGQKIWSIPCDGSWFVCGHFTSDGLRLAICGNVDAMLIRLSDGTVLQEYPHPRAVNALVLNDDQTQVITGCEDGVIRTWDLETGRRIHEFSAHPEAVSKMAISPDGQFLASFGEDNKARIWKLSNHELIATFSLEEGVIGMAFLDQGTTLACFTVRQLTFWSISNQQLILECSDVHWPEQNIIFSPDSQQVIFHDQRQIHVYPGHR